MSPPARAARMPAGDRRQQLLDVAVRVFARHGYERASVADVCAEAKIGRGTFYEYFESKHALFRALLGHHAERLLRQMEPFYRQHAAPASEASMRALVVARFEGIFRHFRENRDVYAIFLEEAMAKNAETGDIFRAIQEQQITVVEDELRHAMERGLIVPHPQPRRLATFLLGGVMLVAFRNVIDSDEEVDLEELASCVADVALASLLPRPAGAARPRSRR